MCLLEAGCADEDGKQEDELDERERDQHSDLKLTDGLWLSSHALHSAVADETETDADTESGDT